MRINKGIESILNRRSCRTYSNKKVKENVLDQIVQCGSMAPSAMNKQTASLLVITNLKMLNKLKRLSITIRGNDCFYGAKTMIVVYGSSQEKFVIQDGSCIMENLMVAASALNVSSCWINQLNDLLNTKQGMKIKEELGLQEEDIVVGTCIVGYNSSDKEILSKPRKENHIRYIK